MAKIDDSVKKKVPELRFSGFTDDWEERKLGELGSVAMNRRIFKDQTSENEEVPFFKIGTFGSKPDAFISRELFDEYKLKYPYPEIGDILISASGSIGRTVVYQGEDEYFQDSNIVWLKHDDRLDNKFLKQFYSIVKWQGLEGSTIKRLYNKNILDTDISIPSTIEQQKIGSFFKQLDNTIALHQRKLDLLKEQKKGFLQKMFPKNGAKVPELRFEGFADDWEERKLGDEFKKVSERNDGSFGRNHWISVAKMYFQSPEKVQSNNIDTRTYVMREGDIAFEGHPNSEFKFGRFVANDIGAGVVSELFPIYRHQHEYDNNYWKNAIQIESTMAPIFAKSITSSGNSSNKLDTKHFLRQKILVPQINEQKKIGSFFKRLDDTIALHQRKLDLLKEQKKGFLQKMFVQGL
ncbi:restriction endonuclease subunit S [Lactococcus lactis]|nr:MULTISPECIES: restriction endonuclease subunit S [Lactococcus]MDT2742832.1 restriction endonuclease subunit S [Lactococcus garvieae]MDT2922757.1 restriction endonuclease subunit S [Lactococcus lactis]